MKWLARITALLLCLSVSTGQAWASVYANFGNAIYLDGTGGYSGATKPFDPSTNSGTTAVWFYAQSYPALGTATLLAQLSGSGLGTGRKWLYLNQGKLATDLGGVALTGKTTVTTGAWHHAAVTWDRVSKRVYVYLDGVVDAAGFAFAETATGTLVFGADSSGAGSFFTGYLDEVRFFTQQLGVLQIRQAMGFCGSQLTLYQQKSYSFDSSSALSGLTLQRTTGGVTTTSDASTCANCLVANTNTNVSTIAWNGKVTGCVPGSDSTGASVSYAVASQGTRGTATVSGDGSFTYTASSASMRGTDSFTYAVTSANGSATGTMTVQVGIINRLFTDQSSSIATQAYPTDGHLEGLSDGSFYYFADLDGDGDLDAILTNGTSTWYGYFENLGTAYSQSFSAQWSGPLPNVDGHSSEALSISATPLVSYAFFDYDGDRDLDAVQIVDPVDGTTATMCYDANSGSAASPTFSGTSSTNHFSSPPSAASIYDFRVADLTYTGEPMAWFLVSGGLQVYAQTAYGNSFTKISSSSSLLKTAVIDSTVSSVAAGDIDGDGLFDLVEGHNDVANLITVQINGGDYFTPNFSTSTDLTPFDVANDGIEFVGYPTLVDLDGDGDLDLVQGGWGLGYYRNDTKFFSDESAPVASSVTISGSREVTHTLTASYTYSDADGDAESGTTFQWYRASDSAGTGATVVSTNSTRTTGKLDSGNWVRGCVTPSDGIESGAQVCSDWAQVLPLIIFYTDGSFAGTAVATDYTSAPSNTCISLPAQYVDMCSSLKLYATTTSTKLTVYAGANCSGASLNWTWSANTLGTQSSLSTYSFNDTIASFKVKY